MFQLQRRLNFLCTSGTDLVYSTYTASLAKWAGGEVKLRFRLSGDLIYSGGSWWVDDVRVTQTLIPGACTTQAAGLPPRVAMRGTISS